MTNTSTCLSVIFRCAPGHGASVRPSSRASRNRDRQVRTISRDTPSLSATPVSEAIPDSSVQASPILARLRQRLRRLPLPRQRLQRFALTIRQRQRIQLRLGVSQS